jgi:hypothetical protein
MALWGNHDNQASKPKYVARIAYFNSATTVNTTAETIDLTGANTDFASGDGVVYSINGGTVIGGLTDGKTYYVGLTATSGVISLYDTQAHAIAGGATGKVNLTGAGVGVQTLQRTGEANVNDHNYNGRGLYFEDVDEASNAENRGRGLKTPGWVEYVSYTDSNGNVRHKSEILIAMGSAQTQSVTGDANPAKGASGATGTADDSVLLDATTIITAQPVNATAAANAGVDALFTVTSTATGAYNSLTYQWQQSTDGGTTWTNISGAAWKGYNTNTLGINSGHLAVGDTGMKIRVICGTDTANTNAISNAVTLTVTA